MSLREEYQKVRPSLEESIAELIRMSRLFGGNTEYVIAGGGNSSVKDDRFLLIKASGVALAEIDELGFVEMARAPLWQLLEEKLSEDVALREEQYKERIMHARLLPEKSMRPSVEVVLHNLFAERFVFHTHPTVVNMLACSKDGAERCREIFNEDVLWVPYVDPGYVLACTVRDALEAYREEHEQRIPQAVIMQNHGLIVAGESADEVKDKTDWIVSGIRAALPSGYAEEGFGEIEVLAAERISLALRVVAPALRALLATEPSSLPFLGFDDSELAQSLAASPRGREIISGGPLCPDQIVYTKSFPLWLELKENEKEEALISRLVELYAKHVSETKFPPKVVILKGAGIFYVGETLNEQRICQAVYQDAIKVMTGAEALGGIHYMSKRDREFIDAWEVENYRRSLQKSRRRAGRVYNKIALVTGAAQGFGREIAEGLAAEGACVVLGDINREGVEQAAKELGQKHAQGRVLGLELDVTKGESVQALIDLVLKTYGGFDIFVSNAGVLRSESVKTQSERDFELVTAVNYKGYFVCVQHAAPVLATQHRVKPGYSSDIIQINSKSGLRGSNKNFAYAGSKFGGVGLTQSFALELVEDGIKVNSICPGNFFDGPLWSDPDNGLFAQYLRAGKVVGARTIEDVRRAYEAKIPMGRGCSTADVLKAIFYVIEQQYETGQALPVTGGQVMLA